MYAKPYDVVDLGDFPTLTTPQELLVSIPYSTLYPSLFINPSVFITFRKLAIDMDRDISYEIVSVNSTMIQAKIKKYGSTLVYSLGLTVTLVSSSITSEIILTFFYV